jgi:hypothetical protein
VQHGTASWDVSWRGAPVEHQQTSHTCGTLEQPVVLSSRARRNCDQNCSCEDRRIGTARDQADAALWVDDDGTLDSGDFNANHRQIVRTLSARVVVLAEPRSGRVRIVGRTT